MDEIFETAKWAVFDFLLILFAFYIADWAGGIVHIDQTMMYFSAIAASLGFNIAKEGVLRILG